MDELFRWSDEDDYVYDYDPRRKFLNKQQLYFALHRYRYAGLYKMKLNTIRYREFNPLCIENTATANQLVFRYMYSHQVCYSGIFTRQQLENDCVIASLLQNYSTTHTDIMRCYKLSIGEINSKFPNCMRVNLVDLPPNVYVQRRYKTDRATYDIVTFNFIKAHSDFTVLDVFKKIDLTRVLESTRFCIKVGFTYDTYFDIH